MAIPTFDTVLPGDPTTSPSHSTLHNAQSDAIVDIATTVEGAGWTIGDTTIPYTTLPLGTGWVSNAAADLPGYRTINGRIEFRGVIRSTSASPSSTIGTLGVGSRPPATRNPAMTFKGTGGTALVNNGVFSISTAGVISLGRPSSGVAVGDLWYIDQMSFAL